MRPDVILRVARKEVTLFFASPVGYLFLLAFLAVTLFVFFWVETFFARNIADARPLFEWMPVLLIFLSAALTMRLWSEERRTGTLEFVATLPVSGWEFVVGKFLACWGLLALALLLTLPVPITVDWIADLDWGPVLAGYLAALLLGGAYLAIGLFVSARTDSQIVSLILTTFVAGLFYLAGSPVLTNLVGGTGAELLRGIGTGARFESISRGVLDLRDLYYYVSLLAVFLCLNVYALERHRWAAGGSAARHRGWRFGTGLLVANLLLVNVWLAQQTLLRVDVTEGRLYSISDATRAQLARLEEPLLLRGYFSDQTHPLLAPLVPQMRDLLREFEVAGRGNVRVEIIDPQRHPELEDEANSRYGIRPVPFQVADRHQSSLVNSYFDVLISYGDQYEVLGFRDLIEIKVAGEADLDVQLGNPEYHLTRNIRRVLSGYQGGGSLFDSLPEPVRFVGYLSADHRLPEALAEYRTELRDVLEALGAEGGDKFTAEIVDPDAGDGSLAREIRERYGFQPMTASLFDLSAFYFHLTLTDGDRVLEVPLPDALSAEATRQALEQALRRFGSDRMRTIALAAAAPPPMGPPMGPMGMPPVGHEYRQLRETLQRDFSVVDADLGTGRVPESAELLLVVDPQALEEREVFAVDQFLMQGGTVVLATGDRSVELGQASLEATPRTSGLEPWLAHLGVRIGEGLVMDPQNAAFPAPVTREVGGFSFQELVMLDYPYFVDIRPDGFAEEPAIASGLPQVTLTWASPLHLDPPSGAVRVTPLLRSSPGSWISTDADVLPRIGAGGASGFTPEGEIGEHTLAVLLEGRFESWFAGRASPLLDPPESATAEPEIEAATLGDEASGAADRLGVLARVIERAPESARLFVIGSNDFVSDTILGVLGSVDGTRYENNALLIANIADWSLEDQSLLGIRGRGRFNRTLPPLDTGVRTGVEVLNYTLAIVGVGLVFGWRRWRVGADRRRYQGWLEGAAR